MRNGERQTYGDSGATLVEVLLTLIVIIMITGGIYSLFSQSQRISSGQTSFLDMHQNARNAMDLMAREIMMAGCDFSNPDNLLMRVPPVLEPSPTGIRVLADVNQDGDTDDENEDIRFAWNPDTGEITRDSGSGETVISDHVTAFALSYDHGATTISSSASADDTTLHVVSTAGFQLGDLVYVADGSNVDSVFVIGISGGALAVDPAISNYYLAGSTVACIESVSIDLTTRTAEADPQTNRFKTMDLSSEVMIRNETF
jgi:Tfp pilus assembly protein PilW